MSPLPESRKSLNPTDLGKGAVADSSNACLSESPDPELGRVVAAWPFLGETLRHAISAIVESAERVTEAGHASEGGNEGSDGGR